jgi:uncharacterized protein (DUF1778 family)
MPLQNKDIRLSFRVTAEQAAVFRGVAEREGQRLSEWVRDLATRRARQVEKQHRPEAA